MKAFLDGRDRSILRKLRALMETAAAGFEFEKATSMRDRLAALEWVDDRLALLRRARDKNSFVYPLAGHDGKERWYLIHRGQVRAVATPPATDADRGRVAELIEKTFADTRAPGVLSDGAVDSVLLVAAWFRRNAGEKAKLLTRADALGVCGEKRN